MGPPGGTPSVLAFATGVISSTGGTKINTFGGAGTTAATLTRTDVGLATLVFTGNYPVGIDPSKLTVLASPGMGYFDSSDRWQSSTAGADISTASATSITVDTFTNWALNGQRVDDFPIKVLVLQGQ